MILSLKSFTAFLGGALISCTTTPKGGVVMQVDEQQAHVKLGNNEVKPGDKVEILNKECEDTAAGGARGKGNATRCRYIKTGEGVVTETLDEEYSVVKVPKGTKLRQGTLVKKVQGSH
ncbi:MAG: hypothetical protein AB7T49_20080 [Oligoflexales bacterium]